MFIAACALTAMLTDEDAARALLARLQHDPKRLTSPLVITETAVAVAACLALPLPRVQEAIEAYLPLMSIDLLAVPPRAAALALAAFEQYGQGRHPAGLLLPDCFAYACARYYRARLLYKAGGFALTDIEAA